MSPEAVEVRVCHVVFNIVFRIFFLHTNTPFSKDTLALYHREEVSFHANLGPFLSCGMTEDKAALHSSAFASVLFLF